MNVSEMAAQLPLKLVAGADGLENAVSGVYTGDLLSWVMGRAKEGNAWVTIQGHVNVAAVALLTGVSCIVVAEGAEISGELAEKADAEGIPLLSTPADAVQTIKAMIERGIA